MRVLFIVIAALLLAGCPASVEQPQPEPAGEVPELVSGHVFGNQAVIGGEWFSIAVPDGIPATRAQRLVGELLPICSTEMGTATPSQIPEHARDMARCVNQKARDRPIPYGSLEGIVQLTIPELPADEVSATTEPPPGLIPASAHFVLPPRETPAAP